jgi:hypothetical protein
METIEDFAAYKSKPFFLKRREQNQYWMLETINEHN